MFEFVVIFFCVQSSSSGPSASTPKASTSRASSRSSGATVTPKKEVKTEGDKTSSASTKTPTAGRNKVLPKEVRRRLSESIINLLCKMRS